MSTLARTIAAASDTRYAALLSSASYDVDGAELARENMTRPTAPEAISDNVAARR
ncbi:MAG: hypothetical protein GX871_08085 [Microbacteriaceae bacterium]|nr:hypothetical protein [Microbacteriaceae bacterium]